MQELVALLVRASRKGQHDSRTGAGTRGRRNLRERGIVFVPLIDLILGDLAAMHGLNKTALAALVVDYHAWNWYNHENSAGNSESHHDFSGTLTAIVKVHMPCLVLGSSLRCSLR